MLQGSVSLAWACGSRQAASAAWAGLPSRSAVKIAWRSATRVALGAAITRLRSPPASALICGASAPGQARALRAAARSRIWSPMATPMRQGWSLPALWKRP